MSEKTNLELDRRFLLFDIGGVAYGLPLRYVLEIIYMQPITHVPGTDSFVQGIINLRGKIVPVIDMRSQLGMEPGAYRKEANIVITFSGNRYVGILVDHVSTVVAAEQGRIIPTPEIKNTHDEMISSLLQTKEGTTKIIDSKKILRMDDIEG